MKRWWRSRITPLLVAGCFITWPAKAQPVEAWQPERSADVQLINDGDSLLTVYGDATGQTSLTFALGLLGGSVSAINTAIAGETLGEMVSRFSENVGRKYQGPHRFVVIYSLGGGNDIRRGISAADAYSLLQTYVKSVHALGPNAVSLVSTYPLQCDIFKNPSYRPVLQSYNDKIYDGWNKPQQAGGLEADGLVDLFADPTIGPDSYASSAFCNNKWSSDGAHLKDAGKAIMGRIEAQAVAKFLSTR